VSAADLLPVDLLLVGISYRSAWAIDIGSVVDGDDAVGRRRAVDLVDHPVVPAPCSVVAA
jgi:hypothetical protein